MTTEDKKAYLQTYKASVTCIKRHMDYISIVEDFRAGCEKSRQWLHNPQVMQELTDQIQKLDAYKAEYQKVIEDKTKVCDQVSTSIKSVPDERDQMILSYRYINGMTWEQIAERMIYGVAYVQRLHKTALNHLEL